MEIVKVDLEPRSAVLVFRRAEFKWRKRRRLKGGDALADCIEEIFEMTHQPPFRRDFSQRRLAVPRLFALSPGRPQLPLRRMHPQVGDQAIQALRSSPFVLGKLPKRGVEGVRR